MAYLGTVAVLTLIFSKTGNPIAWMLYSLTGGGVMLGAIFMATDYATSPVTAKGQILYGIGSGVLTVACCATSVCIPRVLPTPFC